MFLFSEEKKLIMDVLELLEKRTEMLTERIEKLEANQPKPTASGTITVSSTDAPHGFRKDGYPRKKPGPKLGSKRKAKESK